MAGVAAVTLATVGVVVARTTLFPAPTSAPGTRAVVPWDASTQTPDSTRQYPGQRVGGVAAPKGTRVCTSRDLRVVSTHSWTNRYADGWVATDLTLESTATRGCSVSAYGLDVLLIDSAGRPIADDARSTGGGVLIPSDYLVRPGQLVSATLGWAHVGGQGPAPAAIVILPGNESSARPDRRLSVSLSGVNAPSRPRAPSNVGPWRTGWGWADVNAISDPGSLGSLRATLHAPATAVIGSVVPLTVDLTNPTDHAVTLVPCPTVRVTVTVVPAKQGFTNGSHGPLNCPQAPRSIRPGGTVRFAAQVAAAGVPTGAGDVAWSLVPAGSGGQPLVSAWSAVGFTS